MPPMKLFAYNLMPVSESHNLHVPYMHACMLKNFVEFSHGIWLRRVNMSKFSNFSVFGAQILLPLN